jgi:CIC family chloride channel protein
MAAVFAAGAHAPITAVIILFELTGDYRIILPLMLTVVIATMLARWLLGGESIYTLKLTRRGIRLQRGRDVDVLESVRVDEIMTQDDYAVSADLTLVELSETFSEERHHGFPVLDAHGRLWGIVTVTDLERAISTNKSRGTPITEIGTPYERLVVAFPDDSVGQVLRRMSPRGLGRLPVVSREDPHRLVGMVRRADVIRAYNVALARRSELAHRARRMQRRHVDGTEFVEVHLNEGDKAVGRTVGQVAGQMPDDCILVSVHRDGGTIIPHGDTTFRAGDRVTAFIRSEDATRLFDCMKLPGDAPPDGGPPTE